MDRHGPRCDPRRSENKEGQQRLPECFPENLRKSLPIETDDPADFLLVTHVDEIVSAPKKLIQVEGQLTAGHIFTHRCEVRGRLAVQ